MSGHLNGVAAQLEKDVPAVLCFAHCTSLCLQDRASVCCSSACIRFSHGYFPASPLLSQTDLSFYLSKASSHLVHEPLCPTRWTVRTAAISAVLTNYSVLCVALEDITTETHEYGLKAGGYLAQMESFSTYFGLNLSHLVIFWSRTIVINLTG